MCNHGKSAVAKLNILENIILNGENPPLVLRLAYFHLVPAIKALEYAAKVDGLSGQVPRKRGRSDASATTDSYLNFKGIPLDMNFFRSQLSQHISIARRLSLLAGPSPLLLYAYIDKVNEIVCVPSLFYIFSN
jgi:catalase (peroxidase I)